MFLSKHVYANKIYKRKQNNMFDDLDAKMGLLVKSKKKIGLFLWPLSLSSLRDFQFDYLSEFILATLVLISMSSIVFPFLFLTRILVPFRRSSHFLQSEKQPADKEGWLFKRGHIVKNWKKRWFRLKGDKLSYHKDMVHYLLFSLSFLFILSAQSRALRLERLR